MIALARTSALVLALVAGASGLSDRALAAALQESLTVRAEVGEIEFGVPFVVAVELRGVRDADVASLGASSIPPSVLEPLIARLLDHVRDTRDPNTLELSWKFECRAFELERAPIPALALALGAGEARRLVTSAPSALVVVPAVDPAAPLVAEWPSALLPVRRAPWRGLAIVLGLIAVVGATYAALRRRTTTAGAELAAPPSDARRGDARERARAELERVARAGLDGGAPLALSHIVRVFIGEHTGQAALERTTAEACALFDPERDAGAAELHTLLDECDFAKFARVTWTEDEARANYARAERVVATLERRGSVPSGAQP